ncbi:uncharacterized protein H6S33_002173 [Morchella sextelata]|uniref:uncharacterized protein n=1 Tax=Morchella sextelata TaxID=1174677 RepID=UPI001D04A91D|nr:uncharacterized protein H6S33_002173 [Morchella sextelata]KAH0608121.1 hypothetical protein H6S33_002173 [Morchella sextelata]
MNSQHDVFLTNRVSLLYLRVPVAFLLPQRLANVGIGMDTILHLHLLFIVSRSIHVPERKITRDRPCSVTHASGSSENTGFTTTLHIRTATFMTDSLRNHKYIIGLRINNSIMRQQKNKLPYGRLTNFENDTSKRLTCYPPVH